MSLQVKTNLDCLSQYKDLKKAEELYRVASIQKKSGAGVVLSLALLNFDHCRRGNYPVKGLSLHE